MEQREDGSRERVGEHLDVVSRAFAAGSALGVYREVCLDIFLDLSGEKMSWLVVLFTVVGAASGCGSNLHALPAFLRGRTQRAEQRVDSKGGLRVRRP